MRELVTGAPWTARRHVSHPFASRSDGIAYKRAGCPWVLRHDFKRNLVNDGTPEKVAMTITGHKTRSVFDRCHIVAPEDLRAAAARIAARSLATQPNDPALRTR